MRQAASRDVPALGVTSVPPRTPGAATRCTAPGRRRPRRSSTLFGIDVHDRDEQGDEQGDEPGGAYGGHPESEKWRKLLTEGHRPVRLAQVVFRHLPSAPRCKMCFNPFGGVGGKLVGLAGFRRSRKNPNLCGRCCDTLPPGGAEIDIAVLFADVRGSTGVGERLDPSAFAAVLQRFYRTATEVLVRHDAIIDKLIGDEVMALFIPGVAGAGYRRSGVQAAVDLVRAVSSDPTADEVTVGAAVHAGVAFVGNVGAEHVVDFTALGDTVNVAARLQAHATPGQVLVSDTMHDIVRELDPAAASQSYVLRGRNEPIRAFTLAAG